MHKHTTLPDDPATGYGISPTETNYGPWSTDGLTKRERFAVIALYGILSSCRAPGSAWDASKEAVEHADTLIWTLNNIRPPKSESENRI